MRPSRMRRAARHVATSARLRTIPGSNETMLALVDGRPFRRSAEEPVYRLDNDPRVVAAFVAGPQPRYGTITTPVRELRRTAQAISDTDFSRRIPVAGRDEIAELTRTFNSMLDRLEDAFATQRAFVDDAGHELRTPITISGGGWPRPARARP